MKRKLSFTLMVIISFACNTKPDQTKPAVNQFENAFYTINIPDLWEKKREVPLSELADKIEYVPLETSQKSLLGRIIDAKFTKDFIFIKQNNGPLVQFDRSGKYIRNIGRLGRGPAEYIMIREFSIDEVHRRIYIQSNYNRTIQVFSFDGEYIKTIKHPDEYGSIVWSRDSLLMCFAEPTRGNEQYVFAERNGLGKIQQYVRNTYFWQNNSKSSFISGSNLRNVYYRLNNRLHFKGWYNDTVFTFDNNHRIIPKFLVDLGNSKLPDEFRPEVTLKRVSSPGYYWAGIKESLRYVFIMYGSYDLAYYGLSYYDKVSKTGYTLKYKKDNMHFFNDLDGGPDFYPEYINDSLAFYFISPSSMKRFLEADDPRNSTLNTKELKRMLKIKFEGLEETDNSILMIVKLKS